MNCQCYTEDWGDVAKWSRQESARLYAVVRIHSSPPTTPVCAPLSLQLQMITRGATQSKLRSLTIAVAKVTLGTIIDKHVDTNRYSCQRSRWPCPHRSWNKVTRRAFAVTAQQGDRLGIARL